MKIATLGDTCKVLVVGAGGFIGRRIVHALLKANYDVVAHLGPHGTSCPKELEGIEYFTGALEDSKLVKKRVNGVRIIVHSAGPPSVAKSFENPSLYAAAHVMGTANLLESCCKSDVRRFLYVSSAEVYGRPSRNPVSESDPVRPLSPYAGMKVAAETIVSAYTQMVGICGVILRPFSVYGPGISGYSLLGSLITQTLSNDVVEINSPGVVRDYVYVDDLASAVIKSIKIQNICGAVVVNIGAAKGISALDLARKIQSICGIEKPIMKRSSSDRPLNFDIPELVADTQLARLRLNWEPEICLHQGLVLTTQSFTTRGSL